MKTWTIRKFGRVSAYQREFNILAHLHQTVRYKEEWCRCRWRPAVGWFCTRCEEEPPEEMQFVAELAECIHSLDDI